MTRRVRRILLAIFLAYHVAAVVLASLPAPRGANRAGNYKDPVVQAELKSWSEALARLGVQRSPKELQRWMIGVSSGWLAAREASLVPFQPYYRYLGTKQSWRMFAGADPKPPRLRIEVSHGTERETVSLGDAAPAWRAKQLRHEMGRSVLARYAKPARYKAAWRGLGHHLAREAAADFPDASELHITIERVPIPSPKQARDGVQLPVEVARTRSHDLADYR